MKIERCSHCDHEAVIHLHYAGRNLCKDHFTRLFEKRIRTVIREFSMIKKGEKIAVALSGGKDSSALLYCLSRLRKDLPFDLEAISVDEGIGGYRKATLGSAEKECIRAGVEHHIISFQDRIGKTLDDLVLKKRDDNPCSICGIVRRRLLNDYAKEQGIDKLALGHNLDDIVQTLMMNLMRKEPSKLSTLVRQDATPGMVQRIKPLLQSPEREIAIFAHLHVMDIKHPRCPNAHSAFRNQVRKSINETEEKYPGTKFKMLSSFLEIEESLRSQYAGSRSGLCTSCGSPTDSKICRFCQMTIA